MTGVERRRDAFRWVHEAYAGIVGEQAARAMLRSAGRDLAQRLGPPTDREAAVDELHELLAITIVVEDIEPYVARVETVPGDVLLPSLAAGFLEPVEKLVQGRPIQLLTEGDHVLERDQRSADRFLSGTQMADRARPGRAWTR